jgi:hypothetical protein
MIEPRWAPLAVMFVCLVADVILQFGVGLSVLYSGLIALAVGLLFGVANLVAWRVRTSGRTR